MRKKKTKKKTSFLVKQGLKYQGAVQRAISDALDENPFLKILHSQWFRYQRDDGAYKYCEMDSLVIDPVAEQVFAIEVKFKHTPQAYFQLLNLYVPVLETLFPTYKICPIEIVRWYELRYDFPCEVVMMDKWLESRAENFNVKIWNPKRANTIC